MKKFTIYHPIHGQLNPQCLKNLYDYVPICHVVTEDLEEAFKQAQNDFNTDYAKMKVRSTCVGDIISTEDGKYFLIKGVGFTEVTVDWLYGSSYKAPVNPQPEKSVDPIKIAFRVVFLILTALTTLVFTCQLVYLDKSNYKSVIGLFFEAVACGLITAFMSEKATETQKEQLMALLLFLAIVAAITFCSI